MKDTQEEEDLKLNNSTRSCHEDVVGGSGGSMMRPEVEPSVDNLLNLQSSATGKQTHNHNTNDTMSGMMDDPPTAPVPDTSDENRSNAPQHQGVGVEDESEDVPDQVVSSSASDDGVSQEEGVKKCSYTKGGVCGVHGPGAKYRWKPVTNPVPGPDGRLVRRHYYWECRPGPKGRRNLRQSLCHH